MVCYIPNPEMVYKRDDDDGLLFNPETGEVTVLNPTAAVIFESLDGQKDISDIADILLDRFSDVNKQTIEEDIAEILLKMKDADFIGIVNKSNL